MSSEPSNGSPTSPSSANTESTAQLNHHHLHKQIQATITYLSGRVANHAERLARLERPPPEPTPEDRLSALDPRSDPSARIEIILELLEYTIRHNNRLLEEQAADRTRRPLDHPPLPPAA